MAGKDNKKVKPANPLQLRLEELRKEYSNTKYNKATNKHLGLLRAKIANVVKELNKKSGRKGMGINVRKSGDGTVVLVGPPNAGKSSLLNVLTGVDSKVAGYAFTTVSVIPGMLAWRDAKIQIFDLPGLIEGSHIGKGGGIRLGSVMRIADLVLLVVEATKYDVLFNIMAELSELGIKVNKGKPKLKVEDVDSGGIEIINNGNYAPPASEVVQILSEFGIYNAKVIFWESTTAEDLFDYLTRSNVYVQGIVVANKIDLVEKRAELLKTIKAKTGMPVIATSALERTNLEELKDAIFQNLNLECIYLKPKDGFADYSKPMIMKKGSSVLELAKVLHSDTAPLLKYALVNGKSAKFRNQACGSSHILEDGDVVTLVYNKA